MSGATGIEQEISRRRLLAMGGAVAAAGTLAPWLDPLSALASTRLARRPPPRS
jgi:hypothetical protein